MSTPNQGRPEKESAHAALPGEELPPKSTTSDRAWHTVLNSRPLRGVALLLLLAVSPTLTASSPLAALLNGDIWWHLRAGLWILQAHAAPHTGLFSQYSERSWVDCSWAFDVVTAVLYKLLGIRGMPAMLMAFRLAIAGVTFLVAGGRRGCFWCAIGLSAIAQYALTDLPLRPNLFSLLFFGLLFYLLLEGRRSESLHSLLLLPPLFAVWANIDAQFLDGLILLGIYAAAEIAEAVFGNSKMEASQLSKKLGIVGLCVCATFLTPYTFRLFPGAFENAYGKALYENFQEMMAMSFRRTQDFVLLLLVMGAFLTLGRQRSRDLFKIGALCIFLMLAFRLQRDGWCIVLSAIGVIGDGAAEWQRRWSTETPTYSWAWEKRVAAVLALAALVVAIARLPNDEALMKQAGQAFPVQACDYIRANRLPGPIFNTYYWGGFLTWYLPEYPTSIDSRLNLYGDEITDQYFKVSNGDQRLERDPSFSGAHIILLENSSGLLQALTTLPALKDQFRVEYQDKVASVLVRQ